MMHRLPLALGLTVLLANTVAAADGPATRPSAAAIDHFEKYVRPVLVENCYSCHGPKQQKAGLRLDSAEALRKGSDNGPIIKSGEPEHSALIKVIRYDGDVKMPPRQKLPDTAIAALTEWVKTGAAWPESPKPGVNSASVDAAARHWAFQPVRTPTPPAVKNETWPATPIDHFVLAKLEARGMAPAPAADRQTLVRRVYFDLLGLPPTAAEIAQFVGDTSPDAYPRLLDRLLASPHYGERWGRHWLDLARYANERGYVGVNVDRTYPFAYAYRDWVIRALNEDLPYDQFVIQQLAADHLPLGDDKRPLAAMGFLTVGRRFINNPHEIIDDRLDVIGRGLMGLTVTCARCHDHKYDPIPTRDYYSLYGVFASSREPDELPLLEPFDRGPEYEAFHRELKRLEEEKAKFERENEQMKKDRPREYSEKIKPFDNRIKQLNARHPGAPPRGMVMMDLPTPVEPVVFLRGNPGNHGPKVPRQFLEVLAGSGRQSFKHGSGRLELAQAIATRDNPLTARVLVNRVWLHFFGAGLVRTPSDFGLRSEPPTHPELLDHLAASFVENGWSLKRLHRSILLSSAYRQSSNGNSEYLLVDPENTLLWKMNRKRLDFEGLRDAMLQVSGNLDPALGGQAVDFLKQPSSGRRTIYGFIDRQNLPAMYRTFDFANPDTHSPQRYQTTVPQQGLFLLNSPFVIERTRKLVARSEVQQCHEPKERIRRLHELVFGRDATADEVRLGLQFLAAVQDAGEPRPPQPLSPWEKYAQVLLLANEFVFVD